MLEIKNIFKSYTTGNFKQIALNDVSLKFKKNEFVSILGPSGSGKTTLLNIIGGLDKYDSGDILIKGKSTKKFKDKDFDSYRNKSVGFIFQNYNLISHIDILSNVEMGMTLSGKNIKKRRKIAKQLLEKVGLKDHIHKKPNQLSGGQMQRVAIARALSNNPEIILADEPTGALDSKTSVQIMELIKEISKEKLVIMVTHNEELAKEYSDRIITMKDGNIVKDTNENYKEEETKEEYKLKKTKMSFLTALYLSINNIRTKKGRTILTAFASSIGIIGISLILSLSNGFSKQIDNFERNTSDAMPVIISKIKQSVESIESRMTNNQTKEDKYSEKKEITIKENKDNDLYNNINDDFMSYIKKIDNNYISSIGLKYDTNLNLIQKQDDKYYLLDSLNDKNNSLFSSSLNIESFPFTNFNDKKISKIITNYYDLLEGKLPSSYDEIVLEISSSNKIDDIYRKALGINKDNITFDDVLNSTIKLVFNNDFYKKINDYYVPNIVDNNMYDNENNLTLKVVGIIRIKKDKENVVTSSNAIYYMDDLINYIIEKNNNSSITISQNQSDYNLLTGQKFENNKDGARKKTEILSYLGSISNPSSINLYPKNFNSKDKIIEYIDDYNKDKEDKIAYLDQAKLITNISGGIMDGITAVLVAFSSISLIVSSIMIGIITYISVLERTKEIGILRSLGARKKDIRRVFNAETFIIGLSSGILGILISRLLLIPINSLLKSITDLDNVAIMDYKYSLILIAISIILTLIGGMIPAKIASKKNPVESLRTE